MDGSVLVLCLVAHITTANPSAQSAQVSPAVASAEPVLALAEAARGPHAPLLAVARQRRGSRDSVGNGAIVGAVIGAVAFGASAAVLCRAYQEKDGPSCVPDTVRFAAIGGAIGAGAGLAIDAARTQRGVTVRFVIRF